MTEPSTLLLGGDREINRIGFGAMRLSATSMTGPARDPEIGHAVLQRAVELGVDHIDTAAFYASHDGTVSANGLIREALYPYPDNLVIATKVGPWAMRDGKLEYTADPGALRSMVEANLDTLGLDELDLVYLRAGTQQPPHGELIGAHFEALAALQAEGLITHLGVSNIDVIHLAEARSIAPVSAVQNLFNPEYRGDVDVLQACEEAGIAFVPFFPLGGGRRDLRTDALAAVADRHDATLPQIALAWLLALSPVTIAIPGTGSAEHLAENVAAGRITLTRQDLEDLT